MASSVDVSRQFYLPQDVLLVRLLRFEYWATGLGDPKLTKSSLDERKAPGAFFGSAPRTYHAALKTSCLPLAGRDFPDAVVD